MRLLMEIHSNPPILYTMALRAFQTAQTTHSDLTFSPGKIASAMIYLLQERVRARSYHTLLG